MSELIYDWMKNLAVFYIFLTAVMNLVPDARYGEHIRFFMGLLLMLLILSPLLQLLHLGDEVERLFRENIREERELEERFEKERSALEEKSREILEKLEKTDEDRQEAEQKEEGMP